MYSYFYQSNLLYHSFYSRLFQIKTPHIDTDIGIDLLLIVSMNGKEILQIQIQSGVRELIEDIDFLRIKFGHNHVQIITPKVETRLRLGHKAAIPMKLQFIYENMVVIILTYEMSYPSESPMNIEMIKYENNHSNVDRNDQITYSDASSTTSTIITEGVIDFMINDLKIKCQERDKNGVFLRTSSLCDYLHDYFIHHKLLPIPTPSTSVSSGVTSVVIGEATSVESATIQSELESDYKQKSESNVTEQYFACGCCRQLLFQLSDTVTHIPPKSSSISNCTSYFLNDAPSWLLINGSDQINGKIVCPKCSSKLGHWSWAGLQCGCTSWVTPAFQIIKSKVDMKMTMITVTDSKVDNVIINSGSSGNSGVTINDDMNASIDEAADDADY